MRDYRERLAVPPAWWLLAIPVIGLLGGELWAGFGGWAGAVIFALFAIGLVAGLVVWGSARIEVGAGRPGGPGGPGGGRYIGPCPTGGAGFPTGGWGRGAPPSSRRRSSGAGPRTPRPHHGARPAEPGNSRRADAGRPPVRPGRAWNDQI